MIFLGFNIIIYRMCSRPDCVFPSRLTILVWYIELNKLPQPKRLLLYSPQRILQDEDLQLRTKCTKLICDVLPKLGTDMDTCMSFVMPNILSNMAANNLVLKRESIKLIRCFSEVGFVILFMSVLFVTFFWTLDLIPILLILSFSFFQKLDETRSQFTFFSGHNARCYKSLA